jgi:3',5'-cyclic-AMP phosphodiesterase
MTKHHDRDDARFDDAGNTRPAGDNYIKESIDDDGLDRRGFLRCMAWAGTATVWAMSAGVPKSFAIGRTPFLTEAEKKSIFFAQISDSHIGFNKPANADVTGTLQKALAKIDAASQAPDFLIHTGDLTHSSKPGEFDTLDQLLKSRRQVFYVPGEHDTSVDDGKMYLERYGKGTKGNG